VNEQKELIKAMGIDLKRELLGERLLSTPGHYAYLKISEGCDRKCSFCAIPLIRGKHISVPLEELLAEAKLLAKGGVKELNIIAQDTTYYGVDLYGEKKLAELLTKLSEIKGIEWIRLHYAYPLGFPEDVLEVIRNNEKVCKYLDIPLQHIDTGMLKSMKRGVSRKGTLDLLKTIREKVPGISIRTTLIVGYPGEGEKEFLALKDFVSEARFERLGVFTYSREEDTAAFPLGDDIPEEIKRQRADEIMELQMEIASSINEERIGQQFKVIIDREEASHYVARTEFDSPEVDNEVLIDKSGKKLKTGQFYTVEITGSDYYDLLVIVTA
jgi:ribosomal protein S12 methylthiotransferase